MIVMFFPGSFVDRDMVLRYHWGHGLGHMYASTSRTEDETQAHSTNVDFDFRDQAMDATSDRELPSLPEDEDGNSCHSGDSSTDESGSARVDESDEENTEELMELDEMYTEAPSWMDVDIY